MKRTLSLVLSLLMVVSVLTFAPFTVNAAEDNTAEVGASNLRITTQPENSFIYKYGANGSKYVYPYLRFTVAGGSGNYTYDWYYDSNDEYAVGEKIATTNAPVLQVNKIGYYYCYVTDTNGNYVFTNRALVKLGALSNPVVRINGSMLQWKQSAAEEVITDNKINVRYNIGIKVKDTTHNSESITRLLVERTPNTTQITVHEYEGSVVWTNEYNGLYNFSFDNEKKIYSVDLKKIIGSNKDYDDIEYKFGIETKMFFTEDRFQSPFDLASSSYLDNYYTAPDLYYGRITYPDPYYNMRDNEVQIEEKQYKVGDTLTANLNGGRLAGKNAVITWQSRDNGVWKDCGNNTTYRIKNEDLAHKMRFIARFTNKGMIDGEVYWDEECFDSNTIQVSGEINSIVNLTFTEPAEGKTADTTISMSDTYNGLYYELADNNTDTGLDWYIKDTSVKWNGKEFEAGTTYTARIRLRKNLSGEANAYNYDNVKIYFNGKLANAYEQGNFIRAEYDYTIKESKYVTVSFDANGGSGTMAPREARKGYSYTLPNCEFTAPAGKRFDCWLVNGERIRASKSFVANADTTAVAQWVDAPATINNIEIYLDKTPTADSLPCINASAPSGAGYYVYVDYKQPFYNNGVRWWGKTENRNLDPTTDRFVEGREYTVDICILTQDGFEFDVSSLTATLNGEQAIIPTDGGIYATANGAHVTYTFTCAASELEAIPRIDVTVTAPKAGESPDFNVILPDDADYHIDAKYGVRWDIAATDVFTAGEQYNLWFYVIPDDGFYFDPDDDVIISVNGDEYEKNITSSTKFKTQVMYQFTAMGAAKIGDVNGDKNVDVLDAAIVQKYAAGKSTLTPEQIYAGDVNGDNNADVLDAALIQKYAAGKITEFPKKA